MVIEKDQSMVFRKIEDDTILVPIRSNVGDLDNIYVLNEVGARIWELIDGKRSLDEIAATVCSEYEITPKEAEKDITEFLKGLESVGAVRMR
ncbi:MAG: PqqD family protein [Nitrospirae bacterium]|nr:PqqD family protein [Nitrospirota bacterium]MCL5421443.1 PqqD family protein [Nitrospirota bacterium]